MILTYTECSKLTGKSLSTIYRAVQKGKLSATVRPDGTNGVEVSELERVWPLKSPPIDKDAKSAKNENAKLTSHANADFASHEVALLKEKVSFLERELDEARGERVRLFDMLEKIQVRLLPAPSTKDPKPKKQKNKGKKSKKKGKKK